MTPGFLNRISFSRLFLVLFIFSLILRFAYLDLRLLHHDEAVHAWFAYDLLVKGNYVYDPMYHGPFLYYVTAGMFTLLGQSDIVARILPSVFGSLLIPLVYAIYRLGYLDERQTLVAGLFLALSPDLIYFTRFLRHDIFQLTFSLIAVVALLYYQRKGQFRYAAIAACGIAGALACKEDAPLLIVIIALFAGYLFFFRKMHLPAHWKRDLLLSLLVMAGVLLAFYSSFGAHPEVLTTGIQKAWVHWTAMHGQCRICGPWFFYVLLFLLYEAPVFFLGLFGAAQLLVHATRCRRPGTGRLFRFFRSVPAMPVENREGDGFAETGEHDPGDTSPGGPLAGTATWHSPDLPPVPGESPAPLQEARTSESGDPPVSRLPGETRSRLKAFFRRDREGNGPAEGTDSGRQTWTGKDDFFLFCLLWFFLAFAAYAYIGEKVPWLIIHQLLPLILLSTYKMTSRKTVVACISCIFLILVSWHVAFVPVDISEPIVQVQNSEDLRIVMDLIDSSRLVVIASKDYWPLPWYYRGDRWDKMKFYGDKVDESVIRQENPDLVITHDTESYESLQGYDKRTYKLAYWFSYYDNENRLIPYYFLRDGKLGSINIDVFLRNRTAQQLL